MRKIVKILSGVICAVFLCSCTVNLNSENAENNTTSNITESTSEAMSGAQTTTDAVADPVFAVEDLTTDKVIWGPGNITNHQQPSDPKSLQSTFKNYDAKWLLENDKQVCLTFDEGYENGFTPAILDTLRDKKVHAIFFVTYDFASTNPELIKRMIDEGHIVGNHTYRHLTMDEQDIATATEEVTYLHDYIKDTFNYTMSYFRFPKGEFSEQSLCILQNLGYKSVFWSFAYADWNPENQPDETAALQNICESTHPGEIILLHAVSQTNADILGAVIDDIRQQGYAFTVDI